MTRLFGIAGWKNSGKTTLTVRLTTEFVARGLRVATVKHAHHSFDIDHPGTDSFRHREAGAGEVAVISSTRWALIHELRNEPEPKLGEIVARLSPADLVLVEGFKHERHPKIETRRLQARQLTPLSSEDPTILAIAADHPVSGESLPVFNLDDIRAIADFILASLDRGR
jgi:molybdopterin-guanine dinucleotide biosynthesis protein B